MSTWAGFWLPTGTTKIRGLRSSARSFRLARPARSARMKTGRFEFPDTTR